VASGSKNAGAGKSFDLSGRAIENAASLNLNGHLPRWPWCKMLTKILIVALLAANTTNIGVTVQLTPAVQTPGPSGHPGPGPLGAGPVAASVGGIATTVPVAWPTGHKMRACNPNLEPDQSAWRDLLKEANARLCTVTRIPA